MENLAIAYVTCDKYEFIWEPWYDAFLEYWDIPVKRYFCGETKSPDWWGWEELPHEAVPADKWTTKLRKQVEQIPEENIFVWLDDLIMAKNISIEFRNLYELFKHKKADALRIMMRDSAAKTDYNGKLIPDSPYLISYSPNIYKKEFLLECLQWDESPWENEIKGSVRIRPWKKDIYSFQIDGWCFNSVIKGNYG